MIVYTDGDLFESPAKVLVNTVNIRGVMGKGLALRFKRIYPAMFDQYRDHCERGLFTIGKLSLYKTRHKWILNFPTKDHWRQPSQAAYIEAGLKKFRESWSVIGAASYAFPMLGCGNGDLDFATEVQPLMEKYLGKLPVSVRVHIGHNHAGPPEHKDAERIKKWLRSDPTSLPFHEVWEDVIAVLRQRSQFETRHAHTPYEVHHDVESPALVIMVSGQPRVRINAESLSEFWAQLRDHGLTHNRIAPEPRHLAYLMPIFEHLDYVQPVSVWASSARLKVRPATALQISPPQTPGARQLDLFGSMRLAG
ncbi:MAG: macro domain-containing protein [Rhodobacteraceae bacterium]|nr:macro domain-containing protein [Paracoccaceae bacterium]